jgi:hypothetical protein
VGIQIFPASEDAGGGGYKFELIASIANAGAGSPIQVQFTGIDPKYRALKIVTDRLAGTSAQVGLRYNGIAGFGYESNVMSQTATTLASDTRILLGFAASTLTSTVTLIENCNLLVPNVFYSSGKSTNAFTSAADMHDDPVIITSIEILRSTGTFSSGEIFLLGSE